MAISRKVVRKSIEGSHGILSSLARRVGCSRSGLSAFLRRECNKDLQTLFTEEKEATLDMAESSLFLAVKKGNISAIKYLLSTIGRSRGYTTKPEIDNAHNEMLTYADRLNRDMEKKHAELVAKGEIQDLTI